MAEVEYRYPHESSPSPTASWLPSRCPLVGGSGQRDDDGLHIRISAGGRMYVYQIADPTYFVTHVFRVPWSDVAGSGGWRAFRDAILGRTFRVKDSQIGGFISVRLAEATREWPVVSAVNGEVEVQGRIVMRKVINQT
jgi:hypothetical protein